MVSMEYINKIKEFLKDPKKKALTQLGLWFIFFIFVFLILSSGNSSSNTYIPNVENTKTPMETYTEMNGYTYKVTYINIDKVDIIEGTYYNSTSLLTFNNLKYYYENALYVIDNDFYYLSNIEYNIEKIFSKNLSSIINGLEEESKTTYKDGSIVTNYNIDSNKIYDYLFNMPSTYTNLVSISIKQVDNKITKVTIDLTNLGLNLTKIDIEYSNIDNIQSLEFNKNNYIYKENIW